MGSRTGVTGCAGGTVGYEDLLAVGRPVMPPEPEEDDAAILMYTGGTTGFPKGALLEQRAEVLNVYHVLSEIGIREDRRFLFQSPMFHAALVAGVLGIPATGATSVTIPLFDAGLVLRTIEGQRIDTTMVIPVMLSMLERAEGFSPERLKLASPTGLRSITDLAGSHLSVAEDASRYRFHPGLRNDRGGIGADLSRS